MLVFVFSHPFRSFAGMLDYNLGRTKYPLDLDVVVTCCENVLNRRHEGSHPSSTRSIFCVFRFALWNSWHFSLRC